MKSFMRKILHILAFGLLLSPSAFGQIEKLHVERYYVSDANDATDTTGGYLEPGTVTYRIYLDLVPGSKVSKIYGDANHALIIRSTQFFFNNISEGQSFAKDFSKNRLYENTVALDTWLTIGQVTKSVSKLFGTPKPLDDDGSFIGGVNNDGGSAGISTGLLINNDQTAGIPLTTSDGNDTMSVPSGSWFDYGILSSNSDDSTIFGSLVPSSEFVSYNCGLQYGGVTGVNPDSNFVLLGQLSTKGDISFELNVEVTDTLGNTIKYVANDSILLPDETHSRFLKYPFEQICGCPDANYVEYLENRDCDNLDSCKNIVKYGCMDTLACNYDPDANFEIKSLCCYPGKCADRDLEVICPQLAIQKEISKLIKNIKPNPAIQEIIISTTEPTNIFSVEIYNSLGQQFLAKIKDTSDSQIYLDISTLPSGLYSVRITTSQKTDSSLFIKK